MRSFFCDLESRRNLVILFLLFLWINYLLSSFLPKDYALDLKFAYTVEEAYQSLSNLNAEEIELYRFGVWSLDMPYLVIYFLFFSALLKRLWGGHRYFLIPLTIALMDLVENFLLMGILGAYPERMEVAVWVCSFFSTGKWIAVGVMILSILGGVWNSFFSRKKSILTSVKSEFN